MNGIKYDSDKPKLSLINKNSIVAEARALQYGENKYGRDNYKKGMRWTRLIDASLRHIYAYADGEDNDLESGLSHLAHAKATLGMLIYLVENNKGEDDRSENVDILERV